MFICYGDLIDLLIEKGYLMGKEPIKTRKPTHGRCCTCQDCGHGHDECVCDHNELLKEIKEIVVNEKY